MSQENPDGGLDFEVVSRKDAQKSLQEIVPEIVLTPEEMAEQQAALDKMYKTTEPEKPKPQDLAKIQQIQESIKAPRQIISSSEGLKEKPESESGRLYKELVKEYPDISIGNSNLGQARKIIEESNLSKNINFSDIEKAIIPSTLIGMGIVAPVTVPALISALATGSSLVSVSALGVPLVAGAGYIAWSGYRMINNIRNKIKSNRDLKSLDIVWQGDDVSANNQKNKSFFEKWGKRILLTTALLGAGGVVHNSLEENQKLRLLNLELKNINPFDLSFGTIVAKDLLDVMEKDNIEEIPVVRTNSTELAHTWRAVKPIDRKSEKESILVDYLYRFTEFAGDADFSKELVFFNPNVEGKNVITKKGLKIMMKDIEELYKKGYKLAGDRDLKFRIENKLETYLDDSLPKNK